MAGYRIPTPAGLNGMLALIISDDVSAVADETPSVPDASHVAQFRNGDGDLVAQCHCDLSAAAGLGSALSMIPPNGAADMLSAGTLTEMATGNLYEVMNMFSSLFMDDNSDHLRLDVVVSATDAESLGGTPQSASFAIPAGKYPMGKLHFSVI